MRETLDAILISLQSNVKDGLVDEEIIEQMFGGTKPDNFSQFMDTLISDGYVTYAKKAYKHYYGRCYKITLSGITFIKDGGYENFLEQARISNETNSERENLELQQLRTNVQLLTNQHFDYLKDRQRFIRNEWALWIGIIVSVVALIVSLIK